jgi:hypothetical protein
MRGAIGLRFHAILMNQEKRSWIEEPSTKLWRWEEYRLRQEANKGPYMKPLAWQKKGPYEELKVEPFEVFHMSILEYVKISKK